MAMNNLTGTVRRVIETGDRWGYLIGDHKPSIRYGMIDPILRALGWRLWDPAQCRFEFGPNHRQPVDYALLDPNGDVAIFVQVETFPARRQHHRVRLGHRLRGLGHGVAVLTYGTRWEIYDLGLRTRTFDQKRVEVLYLDPMAPDAPEDIAQVMSRWLARSRWW